MTFLFWNTATIGLVSSLFCFTKLKNASLMWLPCFVCVRECMSVHVRSTVCMPLCLTFRDRDSSVDIATRYGLVGLGIESRWGRYFPHPSRPALGPTQPPVQWVPGFSRGVKRPGRGVDHPPPSSAEVEGRAELYICSPSGPSWPVIGRTLPYVSHFSFWIIWQFFTKCGMNTIKLLYSKILYSVITGQTQ